MVVFRNLFTTYVIKAITMPMHQTTVQRHRVHYKKGPQKAIDYDIFKTDHASDPMLPKSHGYVKLRQNCTPAAFFFFFFASGYGLDSLSRLIGPVVQFYKMYKRNKEKITQSFQTKIKSSKTPQKKNKENHPKCFPKIQITRDLFF